ncbi:MAG: FAD/NAD(P)-binding oxidoreductase [Anaerolineaceae bacterium]|jgi:NADPH-dependent 2,4-dienoyl-CoA reductase/sulfur reductase-like enzyme|nr:FAD/NAD(P)-binding oxidoreductase [Anaerolineaceae bacterium]
MKHYRYLIIGGGLTGDAAVKGIRELDEEGSIGMISLEPDPPYSRPPLSKGLWKGRPVEKIWRHTQDKDVELHLGHKVIKLDPQGKSIQDEEGHEYTYDKLLLATGGTPNQLPFGKDKIIYYRNFQDYQRLRTLSENKESFLVIGGGFIGSEIAAALRMVGKEVTMVFPEDAISANVFPQDLAEYINDYYREQGIKIVSGDTVTNIEDSGDHLTVHTKNRKIFEVDGIVAGIGVHPNVDLAQQAGLKVENGIVVDEHLMTTAPDIYAAGDVANFYHTALGKRKRVEHEDNAIQMGKLAGRNMAGANEAYTHAPMFYSDLFKLGYEAVGELNSKLEIVADWKEQFKKGVVYYLEDGRVRGVLLWNVWDTVPAASELLAEPGPFTSSDLIGKL